MHEGDSYDLRKILDRVTVLEESWQMHTINIGAAQRDSDQQGQKVSSENSARTFYFREIREWTTINLKFWVSTKQKKTPIKVITITIYNIYNTMPNIKIKQFGYQS